MQGSPDIGTTRAAASPASEDATRQNEGRVEASPVFVCETCRPLRDLVQRHRSYGLVQGFALMLDLAVNASFEELHPRYIDGYYKDCVPWSSVMA